MFRKALFLIAASLILVAVFCTKDESSIFSSSDNSSSVTPETRLSSSNISNPVVSSNEPGAVQQISRVGNGPEVIKYVLPVDWDGVNPAQSGVLYRFNSREAFIAANAHRPKFVAHMIKLFAKWDSNVDVGKDKSISSSRLASAYETASAVVYKSDQINIATCSTWTASFTSGNGAYVWHDHYIEQQGSEVLHEYWPFDDGSPQTKVSNYPSECPSPWLGADAAAGHHYVTEGSEDDSDTGGCGT